MLVAIDGSVAGLLAVADLGQARCRCAEKIAAAARRGHAHRHADRRQPADCRAPVGRRPGHGDIVAEAAARRQSRRDRPASAGRVASSRWRATGSTTRRRWRRPRSGSPCGTGATSRIESARSPWSTAIPAASCARRPSAARPLRNIRQNLFFAFRVQPVRAVPSRRGCFHRATGHPSQSNGRHAAAMSASSVLVVGNRAAPAPYPALERASRAAAKRSSGRSGGNGADEHRVAGTEA